MKNIPKSGIKKQKNKRSVHKPKKEHVLIVAQEIKFARLLAGNEKKTRDRALKTLKKWLFNCFQKGYEFKENDFSRIWKGLFYAVWMSDKPLVQEELCENIAGILDLFPEEQYKHALLMAKVGFQTLANEWYGIDHHRMDKCLMLVRRYLRGSLRCVSRCGWTETACKMYAKMLSENDGILALKTPLYARNATSMILHIVDCFLEEIAKVSEGAIEPGSLSELLRPVCSYLCGGESPTLCSAARKLFTELLRQSDLGLEYRERTRAWERMGCPAGGPDALQLASDDEDDDQQNDEESDDDDESSKPLDPRAGRVDVVLPTLPVPSAQLANILRDLIKNASSKAHRRAKICMQRFEKLSEKQYPLVIETVPQRVSSALKPTAAAKSLQSLEKTLISNSDERALRGLSRKHRKRLLAKSRSGQSIIEDTNKVQTRHNNAAGDWKVEETQPVAKKNKKDTSNKENVNKKSEKRKLNPINEIMTKKPKIDVKTDEKHHKLEKSGKKNANKMADTQKQNGPQKSGSKLNDSKKCESKLNEIQKVKNLPSIIKDKSKVTVKSTKQDSPTKKSITHATKPESPPKNAKKTVVAKKVKNFQKQLSPKIDKNASKVYFQKQLTPKIDKNSSFSLPKKVKFVLKNNSMQETIDYYKSVRQSPSIPFDSSKKPSKTNLKVSTPSPINPFFKKKIRRG